MEDALADQLDEVESQLVCVECELETLLQKQQELQERKQLIKAQLDSIRNAQVQQEKTVLQTTDWEHGEFPWSEKVHSVLKSQFKLDSLRQLQCSCINSTLSNKDTILIMPTGGGKSLCYQLPAVICTGVTLVISPLVSLMEDQLMAVKMLGIESCMLNASSTREEVNRVHTTMTDKQSNLKLLYVTPEKIAKSKRFMSKLEKTYEIGRLSRIVIDEVHCASQWGHDFRPDYKILGILKRQFPTAPILGLTATATAKVLSDCQEILSLKQCLIFQASYNRSNLFYEVRTKSSSHKSQIEELVQLINTKFCKQCGIVYCFSRKDSEQVTLDLCQQGIRAGCYHADLPSSDRSRVHKQWLNNTIKVIVATVAFGMGIDKPDVRFVVHHSISKSMENYYQESGRAGRDGNPAHCIMFYRAADVFRQSTMVFTEHTGLSNLYTMVKYCLNETECRRALVARSFGQKWQPQDCEAACDICKKFSGATAASEQCVTEEDVSEYCRAMIEILEQANTKEQKLTALKLVEALQRRRGQGRPSHIPSLSVEKCERILVHALLEGVLKEDFHFTPYSTISYIGLGRKAIAVQKGLLTITMKSATGKPVCSYSQTEPEKAVKPKYSSLQGNLMAKFQTQQKEGTLAKLGDEPQTLLYQTSETGASSHAIPGLSNRMDSGVGLQQGGRSPTTAKKRKLPPSVGSSDLKLVSKGKSPQKHVLPKKRLCTSLSSELLHEFSQKSQNEGSIVIELDSD